MGHIPVTRSTIYRAVARWRSNSAGPDIDKVRGREVIEELLVAVNPDSRLGYLLRLQLGGGMVFRTSGTWTRTKALYCYPVNTDGVASPASNRRTRADPLLHPPRRSDRPDP
jgi:hypothetical protein